MLIRHLPRKEGASPRHDQGVPGRGPSSTHLPGHANPFDRPMERLRLLMKGARRESGKVRPEDLRRPVTADTMRVLRQAWEREEPRRNGRMLWAACCVGWFGFLRAGEFTVPKGALYNPALHLGLADLQVDDWRYPEWVKVRIKQSKTDPFRIGATICLGRTGEDLCPVAAILGYLVERSLQPGPLFVFADGRPLRKDALVQHMQQALSSAGIDVSKYIGHSFRIGAATTAAAAGIEDSRPWVVGAATPTSGTFASSRNWRRSVRNGGRAPS